MSRGGGNAIASAAVTLTANADGLVTGLGQAEARLKKFGDTGSGLLKSFGEGVGDKPLKKLDKFSGDIGIAGLAAGGLGAALVAVGRAAYQAFDTVQLNKFHSALSDLEFSFEQLEHARAKRSDLVLERAGQMADPSGYLTGELAKAQAEAGRRLGEMRAAGARLRGLEQNAYNKFLQGLPGGETFIPGVKGDILSEEAAKAAVEQATKAYQGQRAAVEQLEDALRKLRAVQQEAFDQRRAELIQKDADAQITFRQAVAGTTRTLEEQVQTFGMSAERAALFLAQQKAAMTPGGTDGFVKRNLARQEELIGQLEALRGPKFAGAVEMGSREAYSIDAAARYGGKETPVEVQKKTNEKLDKLIGETVETNKQIEKLQLAWEIL